MPDPIITLTTDFGEDSPYVAAVKGVILGVNPAAQLVDLSHQIPPHDVRHAAFFLAEAVPYFPPGVVHVVIVDPGVGSERALLCVIVREQRLLVPDNGCWTLLTSDAVPPASVIRLTERRYWRPTVSPTFHGRDILAPVAGHLSQGLDPAALGPVATSWVRLDSPPPTAIPDGLAGEVVFVDRFGNLITNLPGQVLLDRSVCVQVGDHTVPLQVRTYADAGPGSLVALVSSGGRLEVARVQGDAARMLGATVGTPVTVRVSVANW